MGCSGRLVWDRPVPQCHANNGSHVGLGAKDMDRNAGSLSYRTKEQKKIRLQPAQGGSIWSFGTVKPGGAAWLWCTLVTLSVSSAWQKATMKESVERKYLKMKQPRW